MNNKFIVIGLLFAVTLFFPFKASAGDDEVKLLRAEIANLQNQIQNLNTEIEQGHNTLSHANKFRADFLNATELLNACVGTRDAIKSQIAGLEGQIAACLATRDAAQTSIEQLRAQLAQKDTQLTQEEQASQKHGEGAGGAQERSIRQLTDCYCVASVIEMRRIQQGGDHDMHSTHPETEQCVNQLYDKYGDRLNTAGFLDQLDEQCIREGH